MIEQALAELGVHARLSDIVRGAQLIETCNHAIAFAPQTGASVLSEIQYRWVGRYREAVIVLLLTVLAFSVRLYRVDFNSLSEDEVAKWAAVQEYRHGHFVGVNSEHPMLPKCWLGRA